MLYFSVLLMCLAEVHHSQHHEDEGLKRNDKHVEDGPWCTQHPLYPPRQQCDQDKDDLGSEHVTEQSQCQRQRFDEQTDQLKHQVEGDHCPVVHRLRRQLFNETTHTFDLEAVEENQQEDPDRQTEGDVDVRGGQSTHMRGAQHASDQRNEVDRQDIHDVHHEHPDEYDQCQRRDDRAFTMEGIANEVAHETYQHLDEVLYLARLIGGCLDRHSTQEPHHQDPEDECPTHGIKVDGPETHCLRLCSVMGGHQLTRALV
ncbi:translation initiation factor 2 [Zymobacter palmae]|uniref:Translation initiation factor 2 n=1 Tax=Zymobacter palmae TaxID=33074 RepID=A0A348HB25_9GAMM|nr:translation initiation factor 2 [Zymobacter palmae]